MTRRRDDESGLIRRKPGSRSSVYNGSRSVDLTVMKTPLIVLVAAVVLGTAVLPTAALPLDGDRSVGAQQTAAPNASIAPGEAFAGAIGVQRQELDGVVETRAYGLSIAAARSEAGKAQVVADRTRSLEQRLERLQERRDELIQARRNGSMSDGRFRAELAQVAARARTVQRLANRSEAAARSLPEPVRRRHGINVTAIERLGQHARSMTGPEVAAIARGIAGPSLDRPMGRPGPGMAPGNVTDGMGPGRAPGNASDRGADGPMTATNRSAAGNGR